MKNKNILLGVSGGIAAYKAAPLASKLTQAGANVRVVLTENAQQFITPLTFQALTRQQVYENTFIEEDVEKIAHIDVADWADIVVIAPATANIIGKYAGGIADDMLTTTLLATRAPVFFAPAMNVNMYDHPAVLKNMELLQSRGAGFIEPGDGYLACGWIGKGRMAEPEDVFAFLDKQFKSRLPFLTGKKVLISAGPTREIIDPVRFLSNRSSGKTGFALAEAAVNAGAEVTLVTGPVQLSTPPGAKRIDITTAAEMHEAMLSLYDEVDVVIKTAAVSDYRPKVVENQKVKKKDGEIELVMERTPDILAELGERKKKQILVGFAAETQDVLNYAKEKLERKKLDLIVANDVNEEGSGFESDSNTISMISRAGEVNTYTNRSKKELAYTILEAVKPFIEGEPYVREGHR